MTERFYRELAGAPGRLGAGLALARQLAEKWGGTLEVSSPSGGGTRVEVRLPPAP